MCVVRKRNPPTKDGGRDNGELAFAGTKRQNRRKVKLINMGVKVMGRCREGKSEVPFAQASHKCGKCGARTTDQARVCQPQPIALSPQQDTVQGEP